MKRQKSYIGLFLGITAMLYSTVAFSQTKTEASKKDLFNPVLFSYQPHKLCVLDNKSTKKKLQRFLECNQTPHEFHNHVSSRINIGYTYFAINNTSYPIATPGINKLFKDRPAEKVLFYTLGYILEGIASSRGRYNYSGSNYGVATPDYWLGRYGYSSYIINQKRNIYYTE